MTRQWKTIIIRREIYDLLHQMWASDAEAQRRGQKFTPWVDMQLRELVVEHLIKEKRMKAAEITLR